MRTYRERIDLPPTVVRDEDFLAECEAKLREHTTDWPDRKFSSQIEAGNTKGEGDSISAALEDAGSSLMAFDELHLHVLSPWQGSADRLAMLWIRRHHGDAGFVAQLSVESPDEVEAAGLPVVLSQLASSHAARIEEGREQEEKPPPVKASLSTAGLPWWKDHWVVTIAGGAIAAILAALILQFIL